MDNADKRIVKIGERHVSFRPACGGTGEGLSAALQEALEILASNRPTNLFLSHEHLRELLAHARQQAQREEREAIQARLRQRASRYQADDGTPGPLGLNCWGW